MKKNRGIRKENFGNVWMLSEFFLYLQSVCDWASFYTCMKWLPCKEARKSCGHVQTILFSKLKSGKFERRMNGSYCLSESTPVMVWIPLSYFLFYGFYQSLTYKKV